MWGDKGKSASSEFPICKPICELIFNSDNNNYDTHKPYFHSQAFNLVGCVGGASVC